MLGKPLRAELHKAQRYMEKPLWQNVSFLILETPAGKARGGAGAKGLQTPVVHVPCICLSRARCKEAAYLCK